MSSKCEATVLVVHPGTNPASFELGCNDLLFTNQSHEFPNFEVEFQAPSPGPTETFKGSVDQPITVGLPNMDATFEYFIQYKHKDGKCGPRDGPFYCRSTRGVGPGNASRVLDTGFATRGIGPGFATKGVGPGQTAKHPGGGKAKKPGHAGKATKSVGPGHKVRGVGPGNGAAARTTGVGPG
jgi:hypothetical protein